MITNLKFAQTGTAMLCKSNWDNKCLCDKKIGRGLTWLSPGASGFPSCSSRGLQSQDLMIEAAGWAEEPRHPKYPPSSVTGGKMKELGVKQTDWDINKKIIHQISSTIVKNKNVNEQIKYFYQLQSMPQYHRLKFR